MLLRLDVSCFHAYFVLAFFSRLSSNHDSHPCPSNCLLDLMAWYGCGSRFHGCLEQFGTALVCIVLNQCHQWYFGWRKIAWSLSQRPKHHHFIQNTCNWLFNVLSYGCTRVNCVWVNGLKCGLRLLCHGIFLKCWRTCSFAHFCAQMWPPWLLLMQLVRAGK